MYTIYASAIVKNAIVVISKRFISIIYPHMEVFNYLRTCFLSRFNPPFNMAAIRQVINEAVERGKFLQKLSFLNGIPVESINYHTINSSDFKLKI